MSFFTSRPKPSDGNEAPSTSDLRAACQTSTSSDDLTRSLVHQEQSLLDACAQNRRGGVEISTVLLAHLNPNIRYQPSNNFRRRPDGLGPSQHLLERAAFHANTSLVRHLLSTHPNLDIHSETLGMHAFTGGVHVWAAIIEHEPGMKDMRYGHSGSVVEHAVKFRKVEVLRYVLEQGAKVEEDERPILQIATIFEAGEEIEGVLKEFGADARWREKEEGE